MPKDIGNARNSTGDPPKSDSVNKWIPVGIYVAVAALAYWWYSAIGSRQQQLAPKLLLIVLAFGGAIAGMLLVCNQTIDTIKRENPSDKETRIDTIIVGTILVIVVLCGLWWKQ